jgi:chromosome segregation ATPase
MMDEWKEQGYVVDRLQQVHSENMFKEAEPAFIDYEKNLINLKKLVDKLKSYEIEELANEINTLHSSMNDPDKLEEYKERVSEIETKISEIKTKKSDYSNKMKEYKKSGYNVSSLEEVISGRLDVIESAFDDFENKIGQLDELGYKLKGMKTDGFEAEVKEIQGKLKDVDEIQEITKLIGELEEKIAEVEKKRNGIREKVNAWKEEGFVVDKIEKIIEGNIEKLWDMFATLTDDIQALKEFRSKLSRLDTRNYEKEADSISSKLNNPDLTNQIEKELNSLDEKIKADKERRAELKEIMDGWSGEGYLISRIEPVLEGPLGDLEKAFTKLEKDINSLKGFEEKFNTFDTKGFEGEAEDIRSKIKNPDLVDELKASIKELEDNIEQARLMREAIQAKLETWKKDEFIVTDLEKVIDGNLETAQQVADDLESKIELLKGFASTLNDFDTTWFKDDATTIESKLKDPTLIEEIKNSLANLEEKIKKDLEQRSQFRKKLEEWDNMGLKIGPLAEAMKDQLSVIENIFGDFETDLTKLLELQEKIGVPTASKGSKSKSKKKEEEVEDWGEVSNDDKTPPAKKRKKGMEKSDKTNKDGKELAKCGSCGELVPADLPKCPKCGVSFGGEIFECPICKAMVSADEPKCSNCGAEFELE